MAKPKKRKQPAQRPARTLPGPLVEALAEVEDAIDRGEWQRARELLEPLDQRYPGERVVLGLLIEVARELEDTALLLRAARRLRSLAPDEPAILLMLATGYLGQGYPLLALAAYQQYLDRWPAGEFAADARQTIDEVEAELGPALAAAGQDSAAAREIGRLLEEVRLLISEGRFSQARSVCEQLLERAPDHRAALLLLGVAGTLEGRFPEVITTMRRLLARDPNDIPALSNLIRYLYLTGQAAEAARYAERLRGLTPASAAERLVAAEAFCQLGDDAAVLAVVQAAEAAGDLDGADDGVALLLHFRAVALLRQGEAAAARDAWQQALAAAPDLGIARDNLADLARPADERHAPWPFRLEEWLPARAMADLRRELLAPMRRRSSDLFHRALRRYVRQHPGFLALVPGLLDRGDPVGRILALHAAALLQTPELLAALRDFAASGRGPAEMRREAAGVVAAHEA
jgi:tetratricopeptide (TPR) repeat protein